MFEDYYGLLKAPFRLSPDPKFYFDSDGHKRAMAHLTYGVEQGEGFMIITGPTGIGKTMLATQFIEDMQGTEVNAVLLQGSQSIKPESVAEHILSTFRIEAASAGVAAAQLALEEYLEDQQEEGHRVVLLVDEAHILSENVLEELNKLTNITRHNMPLLQIFLFGQPQLQEKLAVQKLENIRHRTIGAMEIPPIKSEEIDEYIDHRMDLAGWDDIVPCFTDEAKKLIGAETGGIPRKINLLCTKALMNGALEQHTQIEEANVSSILDEFHKEMGSSAEISQATKVEESSSLTDDVEADEFETDLDLEPLNDEPEKAVAKNESKDDSESPVIVPFKTQGADGEGLADQVQEKQEFGGTEVMLNKNQDEQGLQNQEVLSLKSSLMAFIAETRDTLSAVEEDLARVKEGLSSLDQRRKARQAVISDRLGEVHEALREMSARN